MPQDGPRTTNSRAERRMSPAREKALEQIAELLKELNEPAFKELERQ